MANTDNYSLLVQKHKYFLVYWKQLVQPTTELTSQFYAFFFLSFMPYLFPCQKVTMLTNVL